MATVKKAAPTKKAPRRNVVSIVRQFITTRDEIAQVTDRKEELRKRLLETVEEVGRQDADGHFWLQLPEPIEFKDYKGKVHIFDRVKRQRALVPANPRPDPEEAEKLLRKKGLWLSEEDEKRIARLRRTNRLFKVEVTLDTEAFSDLVFEGKISDKEYQRTLQEQTEQWSLWTVEV
jgi:hypothetical protein